MKSLAWTLLRPHTKGFYRNVLLGITPPGAILRIWDAFQRLTGVRTLDLTWLSSDHGNPFADGYASGPRLINLAVVPSAGIISLLAVGFGIADSKPKYIRVR